MKTSGLVAIAGVVMALSTGAVAAQNYGVPQYGPPMAYAHGHDWDGDGDGMPFEVRQARERGFHDGVIGADRDLQNHRRPNVNNRDEYRDVDSVARPFREDYRDAFRRGYYTETRRIYGPGY